MKDLPDLPMKTTLILLFLSTLAFAVFYPWESHEDESNEDKPLDFFAIGFAVGSCNTKTGVIRIATQDQTPAEVMDTWWHEYLHCIIWPRLSDADRAALAVAFNSSDTGEAAAVAYAAACLNHSLTVPAPLTAYLSHCRPAPP